MRSKGIFLSTFLFIGLVSLVATGCGGSAQTANTNANAAPESIDITTSQAVIKQIPSYIEATGNLAGDLSTDVAPAVSGKITEVNFDIGSYVQKGDVLLRLDSRDAAIRLEQVKAQADQQRQAVAQAEAGVAQAIASYRQTQDRLGVKDGETFKIENFSQVKSFSAQLTLAEKEFARAEKLLATGDVSKSYYDQRRAQRDQLVGQLDEARSNAALAIRAINMAQTAVDAAKASVSTAKAGVKTAETQIALAQKTLSDNAVYAPISGFIAERTADVGEFISPNTPNAKIATIVQTSTLRVKIDIPEQSIGKVSNGQGVSLQTSAYPDRNFAGRIARIAPSLNSASRVLSVEAEVQNIDGLLKPGQFATVRITQTKPVPAVIVPVAAVRTIGDSSSVYVIKDGVARQQIVQLGLLEGDTIQIKQGVLEGEIVAITNVDALRDGVMVRQ